MADFPETDRRSFLKTMTGGVVVTLAGTLACSPRRSPGPEPGPVKKFTGRTVRIGVIGCGDMGMNMLRRWDEIALEKEVEIVAVCDVYERRLRAAAEKTGATPYRDYKELLAQEEIDGIYIVTPDHWHAKMSLDAIYAGKHVLVEKPMTLTTEDAGRVYKAAKASGCVFSVGARSIRHGGYWVAKKVVRSGVLGKLLWAQTSCCTNKLDSWNWTIDETAGPDKTGEDRIDWEQWLGPAPKIPYDPDRFFRFRKYLDYSGGEATDLLWYNVADIMNAVGPEFPVRCTASGGVHLREDNCEVPDLYFSTVKFPSGFYINMVSSMDNSHGWPDRIYGHEANIYFTGSHYGRSTDGITVVPEKVFEEEFRERCERAGLKGTWAPFESHTSRRGVQTVEALNLEGTERPITSFGEFVDCVRTGSKPEMDALFGYKTMLAIGLGVEAYRENTVKFFDSPMA